MALGASVVKILKEKTSGFGRRRQDYFSVNEGVTTLDFSTVTAIHAYGDSYTNPGLQASGAGTPAANSYIAKLITTTGKALTDRGDPGTGIMTVNYRASQQESAGSIPRNYGVTCMAGLNDCNLYGNNSSFYTFWKEQYRAFISSQLVITGTPGSDLTSSNWSNNDPGTAYARLFGVGKVCKITGSLYPTSGELTYNFTNDHVVFGYQISNQGTAPAYTWCGTIEVRIDGVLRDTIDCNPVGVASTPGWEAFPFFSRVKIYSGLTNAAHTIGVRLITNPANGCYVDYFGHFGNDSSDTKPLLLGQVTKISNYAQAAPYNNGSDTVVNDLNGFIDDLITEVRAVRPNLPIVVSKITDAPALNIGVDFNADGLHYNDTGHNSLYLRMLSKISAY